MASSDKKKSSTSKALAAAAEMSSTSRGGQSPADSASQNRILRNLAEKMRRDKMNMHISELASIVPIVSSATKRIDKTSVLRLSAAYLRLHHNLLWENPDNKNWKPCFLNEDNLGSALLESENGFLLIITSLGKVVFVSDSIEKVLGHAQVDIIGQSLYNFLHPDDYNMVEKELQTGATTDRRSFYCRLAERCVSRADHGQYDIVHILGHVRAMAPGSSKSPNKDCEPQPAESMLVGVARLLRKQSITELSVMDACHTEYITRHLLDGCIACADHRISLVTGHMPDEVCGKSAYQYIFAEDIPVASIAHREIFTNSDGSSNTIYRLWTRTKKLVYLKTQGKLQYDRVTRTVDSFICINKLLSDKEGELELNQFRMRYTPHTITQCSCSGECTCQAKLQQRNEVSSADFALPDKVWKSNPWDCPAQVPSSLLPQLNSCMTMRGRSNSSSSTSSAAEESALQASHGWFAKFEPRGGNQPSSSDDPVPARSCKEQSKERASSLKQKRSASFKDSLSPSEHQQPSPGPMPGLVPIKLEEKEQSTIERSDLPSKASDSEVSTTVKMQAFPTCTFTASTQFFNFSVASDDDAAQMPSKRARSSASSSAGTCDSSPYARQKRVPGAGKSDPNQGSKNEMTKCCATIEMASSTEVKAPLVKRGRGRPRKCNIETTKKGGRQQSAAGFSYPTSTCISQISSARLGCAVISRKCSSNV